MVPSAASLANGLYSIMASLLGRSAFRGTNSAWTRAMEWKWQIWFAVEIE